MVDVVERSAVYEMLDKIQQDVCDGDGFQLDKWVEYVDAIKEAYEQGKNDAQERKRGEWINHRNDDGHNIADCDQCGEAMQWFDDDIKPNFCPNCGADMRRRKNV